MEGKIYFELNEKLNIGNVFEIVINQQSVGTVSKNNPTYVFDTTMAQNYTVEIRKDDFVKKIDVILNKQTQQQTVEIVTDKENNKYYLYLTAVIVYLIVIIACYFILDINLYDILILMVLIMPLAISKLFNNNTNQFSLKLK